MPGEWLPLLNVGGGEVVIQGTAIGAHASRTTTQSITNNTNVPVSFPTEIRDDGAFWDSGADTKMTTSSSGLHLYVAYVEWATNSTQSRAVFQTANGVSNFTMHRSRATAGTPILWQGGGINWKSDGNDYLEALAFHNITGGGALDVDRGEHAIAFSSAWKGGGAIRSTAQTIANNTDTALSFDTEQWDDESYWAIGSPTQFVIPTTGWYIGTAAAGYDNNISGYRKVRFLINSTTEYPINQIGAQGTGGGIVTVGGCIVMYLTAGDIVEAFTKQTSGGNLNVSAFSGHASVTRAAGGRGVDVQRTGAQTISLNTETSIVFQQENRDEIGFWHAGADTRITAPGSGWYLLTATVTWSNSNTTGDRRAFWRVDGATQRYGNNFSAVNGDASTNIADALVYLTTGQYAELRVFTSGATMDVDAVRATCLLL